MTRSPSRPTKAVAPDDLQSLISKASSYPGGLLFGLSQPERDHLLCKATREQLPAHSYLLHAGGQSSCVYLLLSGTVRIFLKRPKHSSVSLNLLGPGEVLGELCAIDGRCHSAHVMTTEASQLLCLSRDDFNGCLNESPAVTRAVMHLLARRLRRITLHTEALSTFPVAGRIAHQLLAFATDYGQLTPTGDTLLPLRLPHKELGALTNTSREHIGHALKKFEKQGYLSIVPGHRIVLHDFPALRRQCE